MSEKTDLFFKWRKVNTYILFPKSDSMGGRNKEIPRKTTPEFTKSVHWIL